MKDTLLQIRLSVEEKEVIQREANKNRMSMSEFLRYGALKLITEQEFYNQHNIYNAFSLMLDLEKKGISLANKEVDRNK